MADLTHQPYNPNFLPSHNFRFMLKRAPNVMFFVQKANIPALEGEVATHPSPLVRLHQPGTKVTFGEFQITFKVDENLENYFEIYNWMEGLYFPDTMAQHKVLSEKTPTSGEGIFSDCTLTILTSAKNPNIEVTFRDCFPTTISSLDFDVMSQDVDHVTCSVSFAYTRYYVKKL